MFDVYVQYTRTRVGLMCIKISLNELIVMYVGHMFTCLASSLARELAKLIQEQYSASHARNKREFY